MPHTLRHPIAAAAAYLRRQQWSHRRPSEDELLFLIVGSQVEYAGRFHWLSDDAYLLLLFGMDVKLKKSRLADARKIVNAINYYLKAGTFVLSPAGKLLVYRQALPAPARAATEAQCAHMLTQATEDCEAFFPYFALVAEGKTFEEVAHALEQSQEPQSRSS